MSTYKNTDLPVFRVVCAGSRHMTDFDLLCRHMDLLLAEKRASHRIVIVSGQAKGADTLGEKYALSRGFEIARFPAMWDVFGKSAGPVRNNLMLDYADAVVVFQYDNSRGSANMHKIASASGKPTRLIRISNSKD